MSNGEQPDSDVYWHSAKVRMARMVEPNGCDALVDHIFVYRAPIHSWLRSALAIGRSLERTEHGEGRIEWRLVEVLTIDVLVNQNLDGAEVHCQFIDMTPEDGVPFGTVPHPEDSTPVRRHLMSVNPHGATGTAVPWFSARVRDTILFEGDNGEFEDSIYLFKAADFDAALDRAISLGQAGDREYPGGPEARRVQWKLAEVTSLNLLGAGEIGEAVEVHSEAVTLGDADRMPFDYVFHPELSKPEATGV
ncbi:MAG: DUF4288 domain-containing protein [Reyranellaceae bacterium]